MARGLWEQSPSLDGEVGRGGGFKRGVRGSGLYRGLTPGYFFPLLGLRVQIFLQLQIKPLPCKCLLTVALGQGSVSSIVLLGDAKPC